MKSQFIKLFNFDRYANGLIAESMTKINPTAKPIQFLGHLFAAQKIWLNRCKGLPPAAVPLWPELGVKHDEFTDIIADNHQGWINYLNDLNETDFDKIIKYKNSKGDSYENLLSDILTHVINHGTHHRAQIGQLLKFDGLKNLPNTDYIFYLR